MPISGQPATRFPEKTTGRACHSERVNKKSVHAGSSKSTPTNDLFPRILGKLNALVTLHFCIISSLAEAFNWSRER